MTLVEMVAFKKNSVRKLLPLYFAGNFLKMLLMLVLVLSLCPGLFCFCMSKKDE